MLDIICNMDKMSDELIDILSLISVKSYEMWLIAMEIHEIQPLNLVNAIIQCFFSALWTVLYALCLYFFFAEPVSAYMKWKLMKQTKCWCNCESTLENIKLFFLVMLLPKQKFWYLSLFLCLSFCQIISDCTRGK